MCHGSPFVHSSDESSSSQCAALEIVHVCMQLMVFIKPSARMRSEGYCTWFACLCVCVCVCVCVSVCLSPLIISRPTGTKPALAQQGLENLCGDFG